MPEAILEMQSCPVPGCSWSIFSADICIFLPGQTAPMPFASQAGLHFLHRPPFTSTSSSTCFADGWSGWIPSFPSCQMTNTNSTIFYPPVDRTACGMCLSLLPLLKSAYMILLFFVVILVLRAPSSDLPRRFLCK